MKITFANKEEKELEIASLEAEMKERTRIHRLACHRVDNAYNRMKDAAFFLELARKAKVTRR